jgi:hypothetical protein
MRRAREASRIARGYGGAAFAYLARSIWAAAPTLSLRGYFAGEAVSHGRPVAFQMATEACQDIQTIADCWANRRLSGNAVGEKVGTGRKGMPKSIIKLMLFLILLSGVTIGSDTSASAQDWVSMASGIGTKQFGYQWRPGRRDSISGALQNCAGNCRIVATVRARCIVKLEGGPWGWGSTHDFAMRNATRLCGSCTVRLDHCQGE